MREDIIVTIEIAGEDENFKVHYDQATPDEDWSFEDIAEHSKIISIQLIDEDYEADCEWMIENQGVQETIKEAIVTDLVETWEAEEAERDLNRWYESTRI